jgi:nitrate reductase gamma subunit
LTTALYICVYAGLVLFLAGCVRRIVMYARTPIHLRWELYPVPHEAPERVAHGGSYFEESEWWTKRRPTSFLTELRFMVPEMMFLKGLWDFNRGLWWRSFSFHFGLYLLTASAVCSVVGSAFTATASLVPIARALVWAGLVMTAFGGAALLFRRVARSDIRKYSTPSDFANVAGFTLAALLIIAGRLIGGPGIAAFARGLCLFDTNVALPVPLVLGLMLGSLMVAWVPYSHMSHFIAKFFTYHSVRWDDAVNNQRMAARIAEYLSYRPTWSAPHIGVGGATTWMQVVSQNPARPEEVKK